MPKRKPAPPITATQAIGIMGTDHLQCRDFGHSWRPRTARWIETEKCYETELRCQRCTSIRLRYLSARGDIISSRYQYADGYTVKGLGRLTGDDRAQIRLESVLRFMPTDAAEGP